MNDKNISKYKIASIFLKELRDEGKLIEAEINKLTNELEVIQTMILRKSKQIDNLSIEKETDTAPVKQQLWKMLKEILQRQEKLFFSRKSHNRGMSNREIYEYLEQIAFDINKSTFRVYLKQFNDEGKIEKKGYQFRWLLTDNEL